MELNHTLQCFAERFFAICRSLVTSPVLRVSCVPFTVFFDFHLSRGTGPQCHCCGSQDSRRFTVILLSAFSPCKGKKNIITRLNFNSKLEE